MVDLKYIGHSAFEIKTKDRVILIDPLVSINPKYDWRKENITDILLTHAHADHIGEAIEIAKEKEAKITAVFELAAYCEKQGCLTRSVNFGGWINYDWGRVVFTPAFHTSSLPDGSYGGEPAGILIDVDGARIFHAGDTSLNAEMKLIKKLYRPNIALLPIGGNFTMDIEHAAIAAKWLGVQTVIPMHYDTWPVIKADVEQFVRLVQNNNTNCLVLNPEQI